jgi:hypothetical protein
LPLLPYLQLNVSSQPPKRVRGSPLVLLQPTRTRKKSNKTWPRFGLVDRRTTQIGSLKVRARATLSGSLQADHAKLERAERCPIFRWHGWACDRNLFQPGPIHIWAIAKYWVRFYVNPNSKTRNPSAIRVHLRPAPCTQILIPR